MASLGLVHFEHYSLGKSLGLSAGRECLEERKPHSAKYVSMILYYHLKVHIL
jgi:hypothetical protein